MKAFAIAVFCLLGAIPVQAQMGEAEEAAALVRAMRADVIMLEASKAALSRAAHEGFYTEKQWKCFQQLPASAFTIDLAQLLTSELSRGEIDEALAFYTSPAGVKFVDYLFVRLSKDAGPDFAGKPITPEPALTVEDMEAARRFANAGVGKKLAYDMLLMKSPESQLIARNIVGDKLTACGAHIPR